jgi:hypothetical protein
MTAVAAAALFVAGCSDGDTGSDELRAGFDAAVTAAAASDVDGPNETTSKDVSYLTGSALVDGEPEVAAEQVAAGLRDDGWEVSEPAPLDEGMTVVANDGDVVVQVSVYTQVGTNTAPDGSAIAQIRVASVDSGLAWAS